MMRKNHIYVKGKHVKKYCSTNRSSFYCFIRASKIQKIDVAVCSHSFLVEVHAVRIFS
jgi:hypothetical protein